jgi:acetyl esterase/lipase
MKPSQQQLVNQGIEVTTDVPYLGLKRKETLDLYVPPASKRNGAAIVLIHGGGWKVGDKADEREINFAGTFSAHGYICASINYLMGYEGSPCWPICLNDCQNAVRYLKSLAAFWNLDSNRIAALGGSAGGHLSAMLGLVPDFPFENEELAKLYIGYDSKVAAVADFYGPNDLLAIEWNIPALFLESPTENPALYELASPVNHVHPGAPPFFITHGTNDLTVPLSQSHLMAEALMRVGVEYEMKIVEGAPHSYHLQPEGTDLRPLVLDFFARHLA